MKTNPPDDASVTNAKAGDAPRLTPTPPAQTESRAAPSFLARGGAWVVVQFVLMVAVALLGVLFHGRWTSPLLRVAGAALFVVGAVFGVAGGVVLGRNLTPFLQPPPGAELRQRGIYAHVRHPLYTGVMLTSAGWGLLCQSTEAFVVALALIPLLAGKARREEQCLRGQFPEYADYQRSVPQFWPRWHR